MKIYFYASFLALTLLQHITVQAVLQTLTQDEIHNPAKPALSSELPSDYSENVIASIYRRRFGARALLESIVRSETPSISRLLITSNQDINEALTAAVHLQRYTLLPDLFVVHPELDLGFEDHAALRFACWHHDTILLALFAATKVQPPLEFMKEVCTQRMVSCRACLPLVKGLPREFINELVVRCVEKGDTETLGVLLNHQPWRGRMRRTVATEVMQLAADSGNLVVLNWYLNEGKMNAKVMHAALMAALKADRVGVVQLLLEFGVDVHAEEDAAFKWIAMWPQKKSIRRLLIKFAKNNSYKQVLKGNKNHEKVVVD